MPNSEGAMSEVDLKDDEAVVRAFMKEHPTLAALLPGMLGRGTTWKILRRDPWVCEWVGRSNPAKRTQPSERSAPKCGKPAGIFHASRGEHFACVLDSGHEGDHKRGGTCFAHGEYVGENCPRWPHCERSTPGERQESNTNDPDSLLHKMRELCEMTSLEYGSFAVDDVLLLIERVTIAEQGVIDAVSLMTSSDPQPSPVDEPICRNCRRPLEKMEVGPHYRHVDSGRRQCAPTDAEPIAKPVDDLGELERLIDLTIEVLEERVRRMKAREDVAGVFNVDDVDSLLRRVREAEALMPKHSADNDPDTQIDTLLVGQREALDYCNLEIPRLRLAVDEAEQSLQAEQERSEHLKLQAETWAMEAKTQTATVHECYAAVGVVGKGTSNGAEPIRAYVDAEREKSARLEEEIARLRQEKRDPAMLDESQLS